MTSGNKVFAPSILFIAWREAMEASLVIGILLASVESLVKDDIPLPDHSHEDGVLDATLSDEGADVEGKTQPVVEVELERKVLISHLRKAIFLGAFIGLLIAFCIGAAFLAVFYTQVNDLYGKAEELWEGIFNLIAVILILPMSMAILQADRSKAKWSVKLKKAFQEAVAKQEQRDAARAVAHGDAVPLPGHEQELSGKRRWCGLLPPKSQTPGRLASMKSKPEWVMFTIPLITTLREGLEGVVFIGGVSLGLPASSIPFPAIVGLAIGFGIGVLIWRGGAWTKRIKVFLLFSTSALLIIAAGMWSRSIYYLQFYKYVQLVGDAAAESGSGAGSYAPWDVFVHFDVGNPEDKKGGTGWGILNSLFGWNNSWSYGATIGYALFWAVIAAYLNVRMYLEGRLGLVFTWKGKEYKIWESARRKQHMQLRAARRAAHEAEARRALEPVARSSQAGSADLSDAGPAKISSAKNGSPLDELPGAPVLTKV